MVCCHPSIRIDKVISVVNNIVLEALSGNTIVSTPHVAPNFCSGPDPLYDARHQRSGIPTWNWQQKAFPGCRIITSKNPLLRYYSPAIVFSSRKKTLVYLNYMSGASNLNSIIYEMGNGYVPAILVPVNYGMLDPDLQFMLVVCHGHSTRLLHHRWVRPSICHNCNSDFSKTLPCLMLILFLQTFTGQRQVTPSTARSKACSLQW